MLDRLDGVGQKRILPPFQVWLRPVTVDPLDAGHAVGGDFSQQAVDDRCLSVVGIDQDRDSLLLAAVIHVRDRIATSPTFRMSGLFVNASEAHCPCRTS